MMILLADLAPSAVQFLHERGPVACRSSEVREYHRDAGANEDVVIQAEDIPIGAGWATMNREHRRERAGARWCDRPRVEFQAVRRGHFDGTGAGRDDVRQNVAVVVAHLPFRVT